MTFVIFDAGKYGEQAYDPASFLWKQNQILMLSEPITREYATQVCSLLLAHGKPEPIKMYINSPGGAIDGMFAIIDTMDFIKAPVYTVCMGGAYSAACFILLCGEKGHRKILPHATAMLHQMQVSNWGKHEDVHAYSQYVKENEEIMVDMLVKRTKMNKKAAIDLMRGTDLWLGAEKAVELGIVDGVVDLEAKQR